MDRSGRVDRFGGIVSARLVPVGMIVLYLDTVGMADRSGVGIRFIRELEGGKPTLRMDKVNMVLDLFGARLGVVQAKEEE